MFYSSLSFFTKSRALARQKRRVALLNIEEFISTTDWVLELTHFCCPNVARNCPRIPSCYKEAKEVLSRKNQAITFLRLPGQALPPGSRRLGLYPAARRRHNSVGKRSISRLAHCNRKNAFSQAKAMNEHRRTYEPSFFPIGSSYSTPTHTPSPLANFVWP